MKNIYTTTLLLFFSVTASAQWYFELGAVNSHLSSYSVSATAGQEPTPTYLESYSGLRDFSYGFGYLFPFKSLEKRIAPDFKPSLVRLGLGLGFEQNNLRTNATINNVDYPNIYNLAQVQGRMGIYLTPVLLRSKNRNADGKRNPLVLLDVHAGAAYNVYTSATQYRNNTLINLMHDSKEFNKTYGSYFYGAGLQFPLGKHLQLYARYAIDNAFKVAEVNSQNIKERYRIYKDKASVGVIVDLSAMRKLKKQQSDALLAVSDQDALHEQAVEQESNMYDDSALDQRIRNVEDALNAHAENIDKHQANKTSIASRIHPEGFSYLLEFTPVRFALNSSKLRTDEYAEQLAKVARFLEENPDFELILVGYADVTGAESHNVRLSNKRAKKVHDYLVQTHGISPDKMAWMGAGETKRFDSDTLAKNRRTELLIISQK